ncbi:MAG: hypothetical protein IJ745_04055, partial [Bacteroidales bacterium]|nr:hypothetical protein [Bacteroidales bacterium]
MKKTIVTITCCCIMPLIHAQQCISLKEAEAVARDYYGSIQLIISDPMGDGYINGKNGIYAAFGKDMNGLAKDGEMNVPNDIGALLGKAYRDTRAANYIADLSRAAFEYNISFRYNIRGCDYLYGAEMKKGDGIPQFARVIVEKQLQSPRLPSMQLNDTLFVNTETRGISLVSNKYRTERASSASMSIETMLTEAMSLYGEKRYEEAFSMFSKVLERQPYNETASYQLGVMCYKGQGCKQYPRKVRDYMAEFYWQKSNRGLQRLAEEVYNSAGRP